MMGWMPARWGRGPRLLPDITCRQGFHKLWALVKPSHDLAHALAAAARYLGCCMTLPGCPLLHCNAPTGRRGLWLGMRH